MTVPEEMKKRMEQELAAGLEAVRDCPMTFGSLEKVLNEASGRMARVTEEMLAQAASDEADFPPSNVPELRERDAAQTRRRAPRGNDGTG